jgi:hypothetical protein
MKTSRAVPFGIVLLLAASACRRDETPRPKANPKPVAPASAAPSVPAPSASGKEEPLSPEAQAALKTVRAWNDALDRHDLDALRGLYADTVRFYGQDRSNAAVIASKRAAFAKEPAFRQEIVGEIGLSLSLGVFTASFLKVAGPANAFLAINAKLGVKDFDGKFLIVEETDEVSMKKELEAGTDCDKKVSEVLESLPEVKHAEEVALEEIRLSDGGWRMGGIGPNDDGEGGFSAQVGIFTEERLDTRYSYSVDRKGNLSVHTRGGPANIPRDVLRAVAAACRH